MSNDFMAAFRGDIPEMTPLQRFAYRSVIG